MREEINKFNDFKEFEEMFLKLTGNYRFSRLGKVFSTKDNKYFYDAGTGKVFQINENLYKVLKSFSITNEFKDIFKLGIDNEQLLNVLKELKETIKNENVFLMPPVKVLSLNTGDNDNIEDIQMRHVSFEVTERCNLRCKYCVYHEGQGGFREFGKQDISLDTMKKTIDLLEKSKEKDIYISFYGGEPLVRFDLIKELIEYSNEKLKSKIVHYNMTTNCTLMTKEIAKYLANIENYFTTVSLDGPQQIHDANRIFVNGDGSFNKAVQGMKNLIEAEGEKASTRININSVLANPTEENFNQIQNFFENTSWIPKGIAVTTSYVSEGDKEFEYLGVDTKEEFKFNEDIDPLATWNFDRLKEEDGTLENNKLIAKDNINKALNFIHKRLLVNKPIEEHHMNGCCVPSARRLYVTVKGEFAPCERIGPCPKIGNVNDGINLEKVKKYYIDDFRKEATKYCNDCWAVHLCSLCYINCFNEDGVHISHRHGHCTANRYILEKSLEVYHEILEKDPESLKYLDNIIYS
ncbi:MAG: radical SAM protein [Sarcina sp.]